MSSDRLQFALGARPFCCVEEPPHRVGPVWCTGRDKAGNIRTFCMEHGAQVHDEIAKDRREQERGIRAR